MSEQHPATTRRWWLCRVAQEFKVNAATADEAMAFMEKAGKRKIKGAVLVDYRGAVSPVSGEKP